MYRYVLFDLDGTLTDPGLGITNSVMHALKKFQIEVEDRTQLYPFIGPPLHDSFEKFYGFTPEQSLQAVEYYREYFREKGLFENEVYDGIPEVLKQLRESGHVLMVATSKPEEFAVKILQHFGLCEYFDLVAGATMDKSRTRKEDVISYALASCNVQDKASVLMVGDREHDIFGAKANGLASLGVLFGYGSLEELRAAGADYIAEKPEDILKFTD